MGGVGPRRACLAGGAVEASAPTECRSASASDLLGVLVFQGRDLREPDENLVRTLSFVAVQLAQFVERKQVETQLRHQALHDGLTDLPNRTLFNDRLGQALAVARRSGSRFAVLLMDLDSFKEINDTLGHHSGDALLEDLGQRLEACVRAGDTVARLGGDEFGFLILDVAAAGAAEVVDRVRQALAEPFRLHGLMLQVEASVGIALFPEHGESVDELLRRADVAMYVAKRSGSAFSFYDSAEDEHTPIRLAMLGELRRALDERELVIHYQPEIMLGTGAVRRVEALLRWDHPTRGLLLPADFLPAAEKTGLMDALTRYVLDEVLRQRREWSLGGHELDVAVNVSMRNLLDNALPDDVAELLERKGAPASLPRVRDHRAHGRRRPLPGARRARAPQRAGPPRGDRRLRHQLLVARLPAPPAAAHHQDRPLLRRLDDTATRTTS